MSKTPQTKIFFQGKKIGVLEVEGRLDIGSQISMEGQMIVQITAIIGTDDSMFAVLTVPAEAA